MSTHPRTEARVSALERRQTNLEAHMEVLSEDIATGLKHLSDDMPGSFKQKVEYETGTEGRIDIRFNQAYNLLDLMEVRLRLANAHLHHMDTHLNRMDIHFDNLESDMTTLKGDITILKGSVGTMSSIMTAINGQLTTIISLLKPS